jgi:hypothetical protein
MIQIALLAGLAPAQAMRIFLATAKSPETLNCSYKAKSRATHFLTMLTSRESELKPTVFKSGPASLFRQKEPLEIDIACLLIISLSAKVKEDRMANPIRSRVFLCATFLPSSWQHKLGGARGWQQSKEDIAIGYASPSGVLPGFVAGTRSI